MSRERDRFGDPRYPHFLTCSVVGWLPVFTRSQCVDIVLDSWRYLQSAKRLTLTAYVVMENHLHFIAEGPELAEAVGDFKSYTARQIIDFLRARGDQTLLRQLEAEKAGYKSDRQYQFWQEGSCPKQIVSDEMMEQKLDYIHNNPVRRGYVDDPTHWRYSSARDFEGLPGLLPVNTNWKYGDEDVKVRAATERHCPEGDMPPTGG